MCVFIIAVYGYKIINIRIIKYVCIVWGIYKYSYLLKYDVSNMTHNNNNNDKINNG